MQRAPDAVPDELAQLTLALPYNNVAAVEETFKKFKGQIACIIVEPIVGPGNVKAQVTADIDFTQSESTAETYARFLALDALPLPVASEAARVVGSFGDVGLDVDLCGGRSFGT